MDSIWAVPFSFPGVNRVRCLFSTSASGDMSATAGGENKQHFMNKAGFSYWAELHQVHGSVIVEGQQGTPDQPILPQADGQYTLSRSVGLIIKTADCQPLLLARKDGGAIAALHVGWRANAANFPDSAVKRLCREFSCQPRDLVAVRGPSLGPVAAEFVNFHDEWPKVFEPWFNPQDKTVNLWALTRHQLHEAGIRREDIFGIDMCTRDTRDFFFSYRRKDTGRQASVIWME